MTLDDLEVHYALCFKIRASFGAHCENVNEDRSMTLVSANINKVCAHIGGGSLERGRQTTMG